MSRFPSDFDKPVINEAVSAAKLEMPEPYKTYNAFHVGNGKDKEGKNYTWKNQYSQFKEHLKNIISLPGNIESSLIKTRIKKREQQINDPSGESFSSNYSHSEQAILIYLMQKSDEYLSQFLPQITKGSTITTFLLNIISSRDMCEKCGDTLFRAIEGKNVTSIWESAIKKEYTIPPQGIRFFVACVGLQAYPDNGIILRDNEDQKTSSISGIVKSSEQNGIDLLNYKYPTVAQHYLSTPKKESKQ
ncbi:hypothetical protein IM40_02745 [Candidatus Paracaedimonas acanthamoebae]|nr:hypothetical protein IM40_02745 [Candidatus Paracaedimonas acanthamoebae]